MHKIENKRSKKLAFRLEEGSNKRIKYISESDNDVGSFLDDVKGLLCISNDELAQELIATVAVAQSSDVKHSLTITAQVLAECQPSDLHEARLCLQAHILFTQGMHYMELAKRGSAIPQCEFYMKSALKLIRLHNETLESISRYKRQGEQKVVVQHVHVERGGQAIVGTIAAGGGG